MKSKISLTQIENLIRKKINERGLSYNIKEDQISEIKNKIKHKLSVPSFIVSYQDPVVDVPDVSSDGGSAGMDEQNVNTGQEIKMPVQTNPSPVTHQTIADEESIDLAKKQGETEAMEKILSQKEEELLHKETELANKEQELQYKPQIPEFIEKAEPEKIFIFNMSELSYGSESLMKMPYRLVDTPDDRKSMHDLWIEKGKIKAEVYQVDFKKIGDMVFDPLVGTCKFSQESAPIPNEAPAIENSNMVQQAIDSQKPNEPMADSVEPVKNVVLPQTDDMGLESPDIQNAFQEIIDKAVKKYLETKI